MLTRDPFFGRQPAKPAAPPAQITSGSVQQPAPLQKEKDASSRDDVPQIAKVNGEASASQGSQLIVGPNIKLKGVEITDCDTLVVEGHVEATMDSRAIQIAQNGTFSGTAGIDVAEIHGGFSGELTVRKCLTIRASGKVNGKIRYGSVVIEEGGEITGDVKKLGEEERPARIQAGMSSIKASAVAHA